MTINWKLIGIILQVSAGWVFVVDQLVHKFPDTILAWQVNRQKHIIADTQMEGKLSYWRLFISGWRRSLLIALLSFAALIYAMIIQEGDIKFTIGAVIGPLFYLLLGYVLYLLSLRYVLKRMGRWDFTTQRFKGNTTDMAKANAWLFGISAILFFSSFTPWYIARGNILLGVLILLPILLFSVPILLMSFIYFIPEVVTLFVKKLQSIPSIIYWIIVFCCWTAGGVILILISS